MDKIIKFVDAFFSQAHQFDNQTWCILAIITVVFGYFMLRGNVLR